MTKRQMAELKRIADRLACRKNDPEALRDFTVLVRSIPAAAQRDLVVVLQEMITAAGGAL